MQKLTPAGEQIIGEIARRHGFSTDAVMSMLESVIRGNGGMAQFSHPEFGGSGQWMLGGMTMVSDLFNNHLKGQVNGLCSELSGLIASQPDLIRSGSFQSQSQGVQHQHHDGDGHRQQTAAGPVGSVSLFVPADTSNSGNWWPTDLGWPNSTGAQNGMRYAFFSQAKRLAIEVNGKTTLYDTLDHEIGGFSQQQSHGASLTFGSQHGLVDVGSLPVVSSSGGLPVQEAPVSARSSAAESDVFATIEKLAQLHAKGILSDEEYASKKAELLGRL
ncbi:MULTISPECIES: SHOCT domain-containing protein [unclassified Caballeronia]|uniref:SHOCT domain-containing protein n=1 Tax=unclassified Caballeronia TaxID=2646786 RepID=UPI0020288289|nr:MULTISPECIES: SHOCT domain-containing protein [unclassified Caballeronia]MDR5773163.1 SHOCT domain-containing protein [Caballeronia sp. LZ002]MDR5848597.1 SHOCT domain-containing protein [Caballeronia sp. LZ003]